jgi:hypothetical protein
MLVTEEIQRAFDSEPRVYPERAFVEGRIRVQCRPFMESESEKILVSYKIYGFDGESIYHGYYDDEKRLILFNGQHRLWATLLAIELKVVGFMKDMKVRVMIFPKPVVSEIPENSLIFRF